MHISYADADIETLCKVGKVATKKLGAESATKLQRRISELFAATVVLELAAGRPHPLKGERLGQYAVDLHGGHRLVFKPTRQPPPTKADGAIDWGQVRDITIIWAGDYHD